jgi:hypothetical protein
MGHNMARKIITIGDWNDNTPSPPAGADNVRFQVDRTSEIPLISGNVRRADVEGEYYGTIIYDGSGNPLKFLGADGNWHETLPAGGVEGTVLTKASDDDYDYEWSAPPTAGNPSRPGYSACTIFWDLTSGPAFANLGTAGALNLSLYSNAVVSLREGIYNKCASLDAQSSDNRGILKTANTSLGESNSLSVALWVKIAYQNQYGLIIGKNYNLNDTAVSPYYAWSIRYSATAQQIFMDAYVNGALRNLTMPYYPDYVQPYQWTHLAFTYDSATGIHKAYKNGELRITATYGAYNLGYGTHGSYALGADYQFQTRVGLGRYEDIRIYDSVLSATDIWNLFIAGWSRYAGC